MAPVIVGLVKTYSNALPVIEVAITLLYHLTSSPDGLCCPCLRCGVTSSLWDWLLSISPSPSSPLPVSVFTESIRAKFYTFSTCTALLSVLKAHTTNPNLVSVSCSTLANFLSSSQSPLPLYPHPFFRFPFLSLRAFLTIACCFSFHSYCCGLDRGSSSQTSPPGGHAVSAVFRDATGEVIFPISGECIVSAVDHCCRCCFTRLDLVCPPFLVSFLHLDPLVWGSGVVPGAQEYSLIVLTPCHR